MSMAAERKIGAIELVSRERVQAIVDRYRNKKKFVDGVLDGNGNQIPIPPIMVPEQYAKLIEKDIIAPIEDCCAAAESEIVALLKANGGVVGEDFFAVLPPMPGKLRVQRNDTVRKR